MERPRLGIGPDFQRSSRLGLFNKALGVIARNQSRLTPQETGLLMTLFADAYLLNKTTEVVNEALSPKAIFKTFGQKANSL